MEVTRSARSKNVVIQNKTHHIMKYYIHRFGFSSNKFLLVFCKFCSIVYYKKNEKYLCLGYYI